MKGKCCPRSRRIPESMKGESGQEARLRERENLTELAHLDAVNPVKLFRMETKLVSRNAQETISEGATTAARRGHETSRAARDLRGTARRAPLRDERVQLIAVALRKPHELEPPSNGSA